MEWLDFSRDFPEGSHALFSPSSPAWNNDVTVEDILSRYYKSFAADIGTAIHEEAKEHILAHTKTSVKEAKNSLKRKLYKTKVKRGNRWVHIPVKAYDLDFLAPNFSNYVNDAIAYDMQPEVVLFYSELNAGTADTISFDKSRRILRIHDLKTGTTPTKFVQLENYAALYFLVYKRLHGVTPNDVKVELRIYQAGEIKEEYPTAEDILHLMDVVVYHTQVISGEGGMIL